MRENISNVDNTKTWRSIELLLVLCVAFLPSVIISIMLYAGNQTDPSKAISANYFIIGTIRKLIAIGVLAYILFRQGRNFEQIGFSFSWKDIPVSILLFSIACIVYLAWDFVNFSGYYFITGRELDLSPKNVTFIRTNITAWSLLFCFVNPFYEELIARAYMMSEIEYLTRKKSLAVILSVGLQTSYHLYQGFYPAWLLVPLFLIVSLYYVKWRRITPVILVHLYYDFFALIRHNL